MKKQEFAPLSPLAQQIKKILDQNTEAPRWDIVTGKTVSAVKIEELFKQHLEARFVNPAIISEIFG